MDPKDQEIADLKTKLADKEAEVVTLTATVKEKDVIITQKTQDIIGIRKETGEKIKKISEMTEAEKDAMSKTELELKAQLEKQAEEIETSKKETADRLAKEKQERIDGEIKSIAGTDKVYEAKLRASLAELKGFETASTPEEIKKVVNAGANLVGEVRPNAIRAAANASGDGDITPPETGFADSQRGKEMSNILGLPQVDTK